MSKKYEQNAPLIDRGAQTYRRGAALVVALLGAAAGAWFLSNQNSGNTAPEDAPVAGPRVAGE